MKRSRPVVAFTIGCLVAASFLTPSPAAAQTPIGRMPSTVFQPARPVVVQGTLVLPGQPWIAMPIPPRPVLVQVRPAPSPYLSAQEKTFLKWMLISVAASAVVSNLHKFPFK